MARSKPVSKLKTFAPDPWTFLAGVLYALGSPPFTYYPIIFVALIPFFIALDRKRGARNALIQGVWLSVFVTAFLYPWMAYSLKNFGALPWSVAIAGTAIFSLFNQPQFYIFSLYRSFVLSRANIGQAPQRQLALSIALAFAYAGIDWAAPKLWADQIGISFYQAEYLRQVVDIGGVALLGFIVYIVNDSIWAAIKLVRSREEPSIWPAIRKVRGQIGFAILLLSSAATYGFFRDQQIAAIKPESTFQMAAIQANIGDIEKLASEQGINSAANEIVNKYLGMSEGSLGMTPKPDAIIWPETAFPSTFRNPMNALELERDQHLERFVQSSQTPLLFGGYDMANGLDYNAFFFLSPGELEPTLQAYQKSNLLLFGEYIPLSDTFTVLREWFPQVGNFGRGPGPTVYKIQSGDRKISFVPAICYEVLFSNFIRAGVVQGADMILNITNDSWFGPYGEPVQHLALSTFRSVELRTPMLRATNTGHTTLVDLRGDLVGMSDLFETRILSYAVPIYRPIWTLIRAWGDWFAPTSLILSLLISLLLCLGLKQPSSRQA